MKKVIVSICLAALIGTGIIIIGCSQQREVPDILQIVSVTPAQDATDVASGEALVAVFNFSIDKNAITKNNFFSEYAGSVSGTHTAGTPEVESLQWSEDTKTLTIRITNWSNYGQGAANNQVAIRATNRIKDVFGNVMHSAPILWKFKLHYQAPPKTDTPTFVLSSGSYESNSMLATIEAPDADAIYYTLDGSTPVAMTASSTLYTGPITLESSKAIKAVAVRTGSSESNVTTAWYDLYWWQALGSGADNDVRALKKAGSNLYMGGSFTTVDGTGVNYLAKWDGTSWSEISGIPDTSVRALDYANGNLYVGGTFGTIESIANTNNIAKWNGSAWQALGTGVTEDPSLGLSVRAVKINNSNIYVGGRFANAGGIANTSSEAFWDGNNWNVLGGNLNEMVRAFVFDGTDIYMGGYFTDAGGNANADRVARWTGSTWEALGTGLDNDVHCLAMDSSGNLYVGGKFTDHLKKWNGSSWSTLGSGIDYDVYALVIRGNKLYVGGGFDSAGGAANTKRIAVWNLDTNSWEALGQGATTTAALGDEKVLTIEIDSDGNVYAGGEQLAMGGITVTRIAKWGKK